MGQIIIIMLDKSIIQSLQSKIILFPSVLSMEQQKLNILSILSIEDKWVLKMNFYVLIDQWPAAKAWKKNFNLILIKFLCVMSNQ